MFSLFEEHVPPRPLVLASGSDESFWLFSDLFQSSLFQNLTAG